MADDVYALGLLLAYLSFVPFCAPGAVDGATLQRLLEGSFKPSRSDAGPEARPDAPPSPSPPSSLPLAGAARGPFALGPDDAPPQTAFGDAAALAPFREYAAADESWAAAVAFLDNRLSGGDGGGEGWSLLASLLNPDWASRPTAASIVNHPFLADRRRRAR